VNLRPAERNEHFEAIVRDGLDLSADDYEHVLAALRAAGANQIDSIKALKYGGGVSLADGKQLIDESTTWEDHREANRRVRDAAIEAPTKEESGDPSQGA
jgi:ribosomal protein L7/L12